MSGRPAKARDQRAIDKRIGREVRRRREEHGFSRAAFGAKIGVHGSQVTYYEDGRTTISMAQLMKIADNLGCSAMDIMNSAKVVR